MAATVSLSQLSGGRQVAPFTTLAAIYVSIAGNSVSYTTTAGGLAFDLFTVMSQASPFSAPINPKDIVGFVPVGLTSDKYLPTGFALGTTTSTTTPCTIKLIGTGTAGSAPLAEIADGAYTGTITGLVLIARGGTN